MDIIRRDTDYAFRGLSCLARLKHGGATCAEVAKSCDIPKSFAHKLLRKLADAGIVESRPGRSGGFRLRGKPGEISFRAIIEAIQGRLSVNRCVIDPDACSRSKGCGVHPGLRELQKRMTDFLDHITLLEVLKVSSRRSRQVGSARQGAHVTGGRQKKKRTRRSRPHAPAARRG